MIYNKSMNENLTELLWTLDSVPPEHRRWNADIVGYHITPSENVDNIKADGLKAKSCYHGYDRSPAVYLFLDRSVIPNNAAIVLGNNVDYTIIQVVIPAKEIVKLAFDGLYNASFRGAYSAVMYRDNIPADWIKGIEYSHV
jgi:hypothetical protein